ncbi:MAG: hypothetical protein JEY94_00510 [Melioribacteraceae bacterium]|nr:hypothetical protein [Melioribacteraceae bacterium]
MKPSLKNKLEIEDIIKRLLKRIEDSDLESYDPFDGLNSAPVRIISKINPLLGRIGLQIVKQNPVNIRPFLFQPKIKNDPKVLADLIQSYILLAEHFDDNSLLEKAKSLGELLYNEKNDNTKNISWGLKFPYYSRYVNFSGVSNLFTTINSAFALQELYRITNDKKYLDWLSSVERFMFEELGSIEEGEAAYFRYYPNLESPVYNVNSLALKYFARKLNYNTSNLNTANSLFNFLIKNQNNDGSWYYSKDSIGKWIDGFHTGYTLEGIIEYIKNGHNTNYNKTLEKNVNFYLKNLISDNFPLYKEGTKFPIDSQNCSQAIQTRVYFTYLEMDSLDEVLKMLKLINNQLYNTDSYIFQKNKYYKNELFTLRWSQTPFLLALVLLLREL